MEPEDLPEPVRSTSREVAKTLARGGAAAVVLSGSHVRGDASPESDLDVFVVGPETYAYRLERRGGLLISTSSQPFEACREAFEDPGSVGAAVPGWREAVPIHDPGGLAAALIREAEGWSWEPLRDRCDRWVAEEITGLAEEVHKLVAALRHDNRPGAAIQRSLLAMRLAPILAVHRRILYGSENRLWDLVSEAMGEEWRLAQNAALGLEDEPFLKTCEAALRLYALATNEAQHLFGERQIGVVRHARELADSTSTL